MSEMSLNEDLLDTVANDLTSKDMKEGGYLAGNNIEDDMADENFHLHVSDDEADDTTSNHDQENGVSSTTQETEDDILNKFDTELPENDSVKIDEKQLLDATDEEIDKLHIDEQALLNGDGKTNSEPAKNVTDSNNEISKESKTTEEENVEKIQKVNADILKDQVMDTEDLLQIIENVTEEPNDKDSCSPPSVDKENEETDGNDAEIEGEKGNDDGVDIEEDNLRMDSDSEEYEKGIESDDKTETSKKGEETPSEEFEETVFKGDDVDKEESDDIDKEDSEDIDKEESDEIDKEESDEIEKEESDDIDKEESDEIDKEESDDIDKEESDEIDKEESDEIDKEKSDAKSKKKSHGIKKGESKEIDTEEFNADSTAKKTDTTTEKRGDGKEAPSDMEVDESSAAEKTTATDEKTESSVTSQSTKRPTDDSSTSNEAKKIKLQEQSDEAASAKKSKLSDPNHPQLKRLGSIAAYMQKRSLTRLTRNDLEQLCLLKMCESIGHRSEIGELRHQLGLQDQMVEMWRKEVAQLTKQTRDLEIVNKRLLHEVRLRNDRDKPLIPVKITRSVGLQVRSDTNAINNTVAQKRRINRSHAAASFSAKHASFKQRMQALKTANANKIAALNNSNKVAIPKAAMPKVATSSAPPNKVTAAPKVSTPSTPPIKVATPNVTTNKTTTPSPSPIKTTTPITPANKAITANSLNSSPKPKPAQVKAVNSLLSQALQNSVTVPSTTITTSSTTVTTSQNNTVTTTSVTSNNNPVQAVVATTVSIPVASSKTVPPAPTTKPTVNPPVENTKAVIDLTDDDDKKLAVSTSESTTTLTTTTTQSQSIRIVSTPVKTTNANNANSARIMYVYNNQLHQSLLTGDPSKPGSQKLMLKLNPNTINASQAANNTTTVANGPPITVPASGSSVRATQGQPLRLSATLAPTRSTPATTKTVLKHPAPLPLPPTSQITLPSRKPIPPKPHLSIRRSNGGIVLSWKMPYNLDNYEVIASYQLYAYQETSSPPSSDMWRKVGDVKALALPMACTLTQFADGNKYHFAVRAVDVQKRMGPFSDSEQILL